MSFQTVLEKVTPAIKMHARKTASVYRLGDREDLEQEFTVRLWEAYTSRSDEEKKIPEARWAMTVLYFSRLKVYRKLNVVREREDATLWYVGNSQRSLIDKSFREIEFWTDMEQDMRKARHLMTRQELFVIDKLGEGQSRTEIGENLGFTRQRIGQIVMSIRNKMRKSGLENSLYSYVETE